VLVVRSIHVVYELKLRADQEETAVRVHGFHANYCPVYRTIRQSVDITTELRLFVDS
jgi:uncharacterized OsmC-like protein